MVVNEFVKNLLLKDLRKKMVERNMHPYIESEAESRPQSYSDL